MVGEDGKPICSHLTLLIQENTSFRPTIRDLLSRWNMGVWASTVRRGQPRSVSLFFCGLSTKYAPVVPDLELTSSIVKPDDVPIVSGRGKERC